MRKLVKAGQVVVCLIAFAVIILSAVLAASQHILVAILWGFLIGAVVFPLTKAFVDEWEKHYGKDGSTDR